jgi:hypothetical protein
MRGTTRLLVLFGAIFVVVAGSIVFIITRMTSSVMHGATRTTDPSAMMSTIGDTMIWTAVPIVLITAAGILVFFFFMRRFMGANQRLVATGIPGTALVLEVRDTGVTINNINAVFEARLQVTIPGQTPYEATAEVTLGRANWGALRPGMSVAVKVDPKDPRLVAIDWGGRSAATTGLAETLAAQMQVGGAAHMTVGAPGVVSTAGGSFQIPGVAGAMQATGVREAADVIAAGERAEATIQTVSHTGATAGQMVPNIDPEKAEDPMVFVAMQVQPRKGAAFAAQGIYRVPKNKLGALAIGRRISVSYLPGQPQSATIDWTRV